MSESLVVRGFVITKSEWRQLGPDERREILSALPAEVRDTVELAKAGPKRVRPLPLPPLELT